MPFPKLTRPRLIPGARGNVVLGKAATRPDRLRLVMRELGSLERGEYVVFVDHAHIDHYVQFARARNGPLTMEVASGHHNEADGVRLMDSPRAVSALAALGLTLPPESNFVNADVTADMEQVGSWVLEVFLHLFRAGDDFVLEALGDPARAKART